MEEGLDGRARVHPGEEGEVEAQLKDLCDGQHAHLHPQTQRTSSNTMPYPLIVHFSTLIGI